MKMRTSFLMTLAGLSLLSVTAQANLLTNPDFSVGADGKDSWVSYLNVFDPTGTAYKYGTAWDTGTAVVNGNTLTLQSHPGWTDNGQGPLDLGDKIENNFYVDFGASPAFAGQEVVFSGDFSVATPYDGDNEGFAFIKILDGGWQVSQLITADVETSGGSFSISATVPTSNMNSFQVGFANFSIAGTDGAMDISNLSLTVIPEPKTTAMIGGLVVLGVVALARFRRRMASKA